MSSSAVTDSLGALRRFAGKRRPIETCELCAAELTEDHPHLVDPQARKLVCSCSPCAVLFGSQAGARYKRVPRRSRLLRNFRMTAGEWESLMIPINLAFFFESSPLGKAVAMYPSPAGATESQLSLDTWTDIVDRNPVLEGMAADVEALLVNRLGPGRGYSSAEYYVVPIDECYKLVWLIRSHWRGLSGGTIVWRHLEWFFEDLKARSGASRA